MANQLEPMRYNMYATETRAGFVERQLDINSTRTFIDWERRIKWWTRLIGFSVMSATFSVLQGFEALMMEDAVAVLVYTHILTFSVASVFYAWHRIKMCQNMQEAKEVVDTLLRSATVTEYMRMSNDFYNYSHSFAASQSFRALNRCDICGAEFTGMGCGHRNIFKTAEGMARCKGLCGLEGKLDIELNRGESR